MWKFQPFLALAVAALVLCGASSAGSPGGVDSALLQPDGKIVAIGWGHRGLQQGFGLARFTQRGAPDKGFGLRGKVSTPFLTQAVANSGALQADGKIIAAGYAGGQYRSTWNFALVRYTLKGTPDKSFGKSGRVTTKFRNASSVASAVALHPNGEIVVAGTATSKSGNPLNPPVRFAVVRYKPNGSLDTTFGPGPEGSASAVALQPDGEVVVAGSNNGNLELVRYEPGGSLDPSFGVGGRVTTSLGAPAGANAVALQSDGKIVVAGSVGTGVAGDPGYKFALARYLPDGSLDPSFGSGGVVTTPFTDLISADLPWGGVAQAVAIQPDGKLLAGGGELWPWPGRGEFALARYNADGSLDTSFGDGGKVTSSFGYAPPENPTEDGDAINGLAVQPDGKIIAAGVSQFGPHTEQYAVALARYQSDGSLDQSFGTGGLVKTSLALCVVPHLSGQKMDWFAQKWIKGSHCSVGKIERVHSRRVKRRRIISEKPRPGTVHVEGTRVRVVVSLGRP
jgi:uncharacterized delta-60 repeat protein